MGHGATGDRRRQGGVGWADGHGDAGSERWEVSVRPYVLIVSLPKT
jgi:hypothetical protein